MEPKSQTLLETLFYLKGLIEGMAGVDAYYLKEACATAIRLAQEDAEWHKQMDV
jgi:hypothetical protein